jgi:Mg/Co/Ni transporter MgtE
VRRAPIVDRQRQLRGIVLVDDLIAVIATELMQLARLIRREQSRELKKTEDPFQDEFAT